MPEGFRQDDIIDGKMYAVLSYLSILCIIPLILKKSNPFVLGHGRQGLVLFVAEAAVFIAGSIVPVLFTPGMFVLMALSFWGMVAAIRGTMVELPVVAGIAKKIAL